MTLPVFGQRRELIKSSELIKRRELIKSRELMTEAEGGRTNMTKKYHAMIIGATGLVGTLLLERLLADDACAQLFVFTRRPLNAESTKLSTIICDNDTFNAQSQQYAETLSAVDYAFCCLGTTMKKVGGDKAAFTAVDYHYVMAFADFAAHLGVVSFSVISSVGADKPRGFYLQTKAKMERSLQEKGFKQLLIYRPSVLLGKRREGRLAEGLGGTLLALGSPLLRSGLAKYQAVKAECLAQAMHRVTSSEDLSSQQSTRKAADTTLRVVVIGSGKINHHCS